MVFIFHSKGELLGIQSRRELKENSIPTLFDNAPLSKKINGPCRQIIKDELLHAPEKIEENPPNV